MIYKIIIENFFSIADAQELTLGVLDNAPDLPCFRSPSSSNKTRLPTVVGFFGPNASGKSTILRAVVSAIKFALDSFEWPDFAGNHMFQAYRQKNWWEKPTKIVIEFDGQLIGDAPSTIFRYELHISHRANDPSKIVSYEALRYAPKGRFRLLFERTYQKFHFGPEFDINETNDPRKESIRPNASVISTLARFNHPMSVYLCKQIAAVQTNYIGVKKVFSGPGQWLTAYANDKACLDHLNRELRRFDVGLESMTVEQGNQGLFAKFQHVGLDGFVYLEEESQGTQSFINIFPRLHYALETGSVAIIDEIDADFHPLLLPELFRWFNDLERNPRGAQLFFTAHNPALLDDLEKEQVFFTQKPSGNSTQIYGARDIKGLRREPSLMKKYLAGELGAVPRIG